jgi:hypothetical protein
MILNSVGGTYTDKEIPTSLSGNSLIIRSFLPIFRAV